MLPQSYQDMLQVQRGRAAVRATVGRGLGHGQPDPARGTNAAGGGYLPRDFVSRRNRREVPAAGKLLLRLSFKHGSNLSCEPVARPGADNARRRRTGPVRPEDERAGLDGGVGDRGAGLGCLRSSKSKPGDHCVCASWQGWWIASPVIRLYSPFDAITTAT